MKTTREKLMDAAAEQLKNHPTVYITEIDLRTHMKKLNDLDLTVFAISIGVDTDAIWAEAVRS